MIEYNYPHNFMIFNAVRKVNEIFATGEIFRLMRSHAQFDFTNQSPGSIAETVQAFWRTQTIKIKTYKSLWPWSKVNAYTENCDEIWINTRNIPVELNQLAGTIAHELVHAANRWINPNVNPSMAIFGHGDNSPVAKENSVPYFVGNAIKRLSQY